MDVPIDTPNGFSLPTDGRAIAYVLREKGWLIAAILLVTVAAGLTYIVRSEKVFEATTTVEIEPEQQRIISAEPRRPDERSEEVIKTIEQNLKGPSLLLRLTRHPELTNDPAFLAGISASISPARLEQIVSGKITVRVRPGTRLIDVSAEDASPVLAQKMSRLLVDEFIRSTSESRAEVSQTAHEFLQKEAERLKGALARSEEALQRYKEQSRAVSLEEKQNIIVERLRELNVKVTTAKAERLKLEADQAQIEQLAGVSPQRLLTLPSVAGATEVADIQRKISAKEAEIGTLGLRYKAAHPKAIEAAGNLAELQDNLTEAIRKAADLVGTGLTAARATEAKLEEALRAQESMALELSGTAIPFNSLAREVDANRALYQSLLAKLKESDVGQSVSPYAVRVVAVPVVPDRPVKPNRRLILLLSVFGGFALSGTWVLGRYALDQSIRTVDQAERCFGLPVLGAIPRQRRPRLRETPGLLAQKPHSAVAEAFCALRTTLLLAQKSAPPKVVLFASALPGEGKTFCAINYAVALAQQGFRTLLVDVDLRLPSVARAFFGGEQSRGVADLLSRRAGLGDVACVTDIANLWVLPAGPAVQNPAEIVGNADIAEFLRAARQDFDRVVIDTSPVNAVSETAFFAAHVDALCLVIRAAHTPAASIARAIQQLRQSSARVAGLIVNGLPVRGGSYYHYQATGYGRDEVYGASAAAKR